jgi:serine/threonine protein kinase
MNVAPTVTRPSLRGVPKGPGHLARGAIVADSYRIGEVLGWGGMGVVYEATDLRLGRKVALKISLEPNDQALRTEAQALAMLQHPGIAAVHWMGVHEGHDFFVMERIYGKTLWDHLDARMRHGKLPEIPEVLRVLRGVADALAAVHDRGMVHRDVKPSNVMLAPNNRVVLMDFGLLSAGEVVGPEGLCGTFEYIAPELVGQEGAARAPTDVYALGIMAFQLLTGQLPFEGPTLVNILSQHVSQEAPDVRALAPEVPPMIAELVAELLRKDPDSRPDARSLTHRLGRIADLFPTLKVGPLRILVVDDEPPMNKMLCLTLKTRVPGVVVASARDGDEALREIHLGTPDVMVLDLHMPRMSGVELVMHLRGLDVTTEVVAVSAGAQEKDVEVLARLGVHRFERKGDNFLDRVCAHVRAAQSARSPRV